MNLVRIVSIGVEKKTKQNQAKPTCKGVKSSSCSLYTCDKSSIRWNKLRAIKTISSFSEDIRDISVLLVCLYGWEKEAGHDSSWQTKPIPRINVQALKISRQTNKMCKREKGDNSLHKKRRWKNRYPSEISVKYKIMHWYASREKQSFRA